jgi:hypothetical protein
MSLLSGNATVFNPIRRNRKIGQTQGGRVSSGRANEKWSRFFGHVIWNQLSEESQPGQASRVFVENPSRNFFHPCAPEEYLATLSRLPLEDTRYLKAIVLERPSIKDQRLGVEGRRRFSCVIINAFPHDMRMEWKNAPSEATIRHYRPWCASWHFDGDRWYLEWTLDEIKRYYLYHLFLHELGHINQPMYHALKRREDFAEGFALAKARELGELV